MIRVSTKQFLIATPLLVLVAACAEEVPSEGGETAAAGDDTPTEIAERQDNFEGISDAFKVIRTELEGDPDMAAIEAAATDINARAQRITSLFPEGTSVDAGYDTEALAAIWERPDEFEAAAQRLVDESATMMTLAAGGDAGAVAEQVAALGGSCKGCHDNFRLDDD